MDIEERIFDKLDQLHDEIHQCTLDIAEIKQWKRDQDEFDDQQTDEHRFGWEKLFGLGGIAFGLIAIALTFI